MVESNPTPGTPLPCLYMSPLLEYMLLYCSSSLPRVSRLSSSPPSVFPFFFPSFFPFLCLFPLSLSLSLSLFFSLLPSTLPPSGLFTRVRPPHNAASVVLPAAPPMVNDVAKGTANDEEEEEEEEEEEDEKEKDEEGKEEGDEEEGNEKEEEVAMAPQGARCR